ncbi:MAG TPA: glycerate kinase [Candidatus Dormibacteraeota bacterium]|nr:glycerate kinase [Candidatus Dormibacteraeota bacterium]
MALKVLVVPDKFKGTLSAAQAAMAIVRGWHGVRPLDDVEYLPMSDGGDGFGEVLSSLMGAAPQRVKTVDAAHRPLETTWWWHEPTQTAVIESARIIGLAMLPAGKYHPFELDTLGLGNVIRTAIGAGARHCLIGIGGSATNDGGFGMARALGWQFCNAHEQEITRWTELHRLTAMRVPDTPRCFDDLRVAVDVQNPLLGPAGCSLVYGPQKGLAEFEFAERCLSQMANVLEKQLHLSYADTPGAGAAGGLGFGLMTFAGARPESGFALFADQARLRERVEAVDLVITGEGALDAQTLMGKGVGQVADLCGRAGVPCVGLAGTVTNPDQARTKFRVARGLTPDLTDRETAFREPAVWLERLAARVASEWAF